MIITPNKQRLPTVTETHILGFFGEYRFLSNFEIFDLPIKYDGIEFFSSEAAYMAAKTDDRASKIYISTLTPNKARYHGQTVPLREDWEDVKIDIMYDILKLKFDIPSLRLKLMATGEKYLEETNNWKDHFWGVDEYGLNVLGKLLMKIRSYNLLSYF